MLLFVIHHLWSIIGDSGFVVSLILLSTVALLSFHRSTGKLGSRPVPADDILLEEHSQTTYENLLYVKALLGTQPFVLVAAACDLPRAMAVGHKLGVAPRRPPPRARN